MIRQIVHLRLDPDLAPSVAAWCDRRGAKVDAFSPDGRIILADVIAEADLAAKLVRLMGDYVTGLGIVR